MLYMMLEKKIPIVSFWHFAIHIALRSSSSSTRTNCVKHLWTFLFGTLSQQSQPYPFPTSPNLTATHRSSKPSRMRIFNPVISLVACRAGLEEDSEGWAGFSIPRRGNSLDLTEAYNLPRLRYSSSVKSTTQSTGGRSSSESSHPSLSRSKSLTTNGSSKSTQSQSRISLETMRNLPSLSRRRRRRKLEKQIEEEWELKTPEQVHMEKESERQRQRELAKEIEREERRAFLGMWSDFQSSVPQVRRARLASEGRIRFSDSEETDSLEAENVRVARRSNSLSIGQVERQL